MALYLRHILVENSLRQFLSDFRYIGKRDDDYFVATHCQDKILHSVIDADEVLLLMAASGYHT